MPTDDPANPEAPPPGDPAAPRPVAGWLLVAGVVALAFNLRPGATSVGPVLGAVQADLGMSATLAGVLTALPGLCFAVFGILAVGLSLRVGLNHAILLGGTAIGVGLLARAAAPEPAGFLALTALAFAGMGVCNVLLPAFIKRSFPRRLSSVMSVYAMLLAAGAAVPPAVVGPLLLLPGGWRASLAAWGVLALASATLWIGLARSERTARAASAPAPAPKLKLTHLLGSRKAAALAVFFGVQSMQFYVLMGWLAPMYIAAGIDTATAGLMLSIVAGLAIPLGMVMPTIVGRVRNLTWPIVAMGLVLVAGYLGLLLGVASAPLLWAILLGLSGASFPTAIALLTSRTRDAHVTTLVSGFSQPFGYVLAGLGPLLFGVAVELTGGFTVPLIGLLASVVVMVGAGIDAARPGYVDDELPAGT